MNVIEYLLENKIIVYNWRDRRYMKTIRDNEEEKKKYGDFNIVFIGHPMRQKQELVIENEKYNISFDGFNDEKNNEDPFIWNKNFLYSFCHANHALSAEIRQKINKEKEEVYLVFVAPTKENPEIVEIDTILKAKEIYEWPNKNERFEENLCSQIFNENVVKHHLPNLPGDGTISEHDNVNLYICVGKADGSFLPMVKGKKEDEGKFIPFIFDKDRSKDLLDLIQIKNSNRYYVAKKTSPRIFNNKNKKDKFVSITKIVLDLIKEEHDSRNKLIDGKRFLRANQIYNLDEDYRNQDQSESVNK